MKSDFLDATTEVAWDGNVVWINRGGANIGRFGRFGIDIHNLPKAQLLTGRQCLFCLDCPKGTTFHEWQTFCVKMRDLYGITVPPETIPNHAKRQ